LPFSSFSRKATVDFVETYEQWFQRRQAATVLKKLFGVARYYGFVATDEAAGLRLSRGRPRDRIWSDKEIARWMIACRG
jgi:hypothetical protein